MPRDEREAAPSAEPQDPALAAAFARLEAMSKSRDTLSTEAAKEDALRAAAEEAARVRRFDDPSPRF